jgi:hypothetical protein
VFLGHVPLLRSGRACQLNPTPCLCNTSAGGPYAVHGDSTLASMQPSRRPRSTEGRTPAKATHTPSAAVCGFESSRSSILYPVSLRAHSRCVLTRRFPTLPGPADRCSRRIPVARILMSSPEQCWSFSGRYRRVRGLGEMDSGRCRRHRRASEGATLYANRFRAKHQSGVTANTLTKIVLRGAVLGATVYSEFLGARPAEGDGHSLEAAAETTISKAADRDVVPFVRRRAR